VQTFISTDRAVAPSIERKRKHFLSAGYFEGSLEYMKHVSRGETHPFCSWGVTLANSHLM